MATDTHPGPLSLPRKPIYQTMQGKVDFYELFKKIERTFETCFLLESLGPHSTDSRYSIIGFGPTAVIRAREYTLLINEKKYSSDNPYADLRAYVPQNILSRSYAGGLVGYLSYDAVNYFEPSVHAKAHPLFDQCMFGVYTDGLILDKLTGEISYFYYTEDRSKKIEELMTGTDVPDAAYGTVVRDDGARMSEDEHAVIVNSVKEHIAAGTVFQCEVGFQTHYRISGSPVPLYSRLREVNPSPHMYYLKFGDRVILGASPELLLRVRQREVETFPLAGTIRRGDTSLEDQELAKELLGDEKEQAEHRMLVDLHRNDIGRVARFGTVSVRRFMEIKKFSHVQHIASEIAGVMRYDKDMFDALAGVFPAGTLTGAPKIESMKIIEQNEQTARGPYGGAVGHFGFNGDCTFAIPIRTLFVAGDYAYTQTCGGIVADSVAEKEYEEIQRKQAAMDEVMAYKR